ncbi:CPBP family intramembrane glutamic endopeptidase [Nocardia acidivorans]|uniref:CPBP family intramembrane glutamic endopeptidase n=1 Tax=Nocardia acidivorans TaxID=404580 RepID=UPI00082B07B1|nr:CPBP family intramembrane glutamic endopeptidase [Nocardia acidivorans]
MRGLKAAAAVALPLLWSDRLLPAMKLDVRGRTAANTAFAISYSIALQGNPRWISERGLRAGTIAGGVVLTGYGAALAIPPIRRQLAGAEHRGPAVSTLEWAGLHIPGGTVYSEELVYRATLTPLLERTLGGSGRWLGALTFGLSHIRAARSAGDSVPGTIAVTGLAGALMDALYRHTGSATAPALLHLAINSGGALLPFAARRISGPVGGRR